MKSRKEERLNAACTELLKVKQRIEKSDEHALKCAKLNLSFKDLYPEEYSDYQEAIVLYNDIEKEIEAIKAEPDEEEQRPEEIEEA